MGGRQLLHCSAQVGVVFLMQLIAICSMRPMATALWHGGLP